jgi:hypothetical protein
VSKQERHGETVRQTSTASCGALRCGSGRASPYPTGSVRRKRGRPPSPGLRCLERCSTARDDCRFQCNCLEGRSRTGGYRPVERPPIGQAPAPDRRTVDAVHFPLGPRPLPLAYAYACAGTGCACARRHPPGMPDSRAGRPSLPAPRAYAVCGGRGACASAELGGFWCLRSFLDDAHYRLASRIAT